MVYLPENICKLFSMGLVKFQVNNVISSCELYRQYFDEHLG
ncbi:MULTISPECIES: AAA-like domain-containing protein [Calothrix]|nr:MULTISPECIES: AAA-like domain-containing protein [Calothrix]